MINNISNDQVFDGAPFLQNKILFLNSSINKEYAYWVLENNSVNLIAQSAK